MSNSHAYIRESALVDWRERLANLNKDSLDLLKQYQDKVNELEQYMKGNVAEGFIRDETATIKDNVLFHENMKDLEKMINIVIEKMKSY